MERNLQEQVLYLTEELNKIKESLGAALPDPIAGPQGEQGIQGLRGVQGEQGFGIVGFGTQLPSSGRDGDWFLLKKSTMTGIDFVMCRCVSQHWVEQFSIRGPAGPIANATEVVANPEENASDTLYKITVDGVTYDVLSSETRSYLSALENDFQYDSGNDEYTLEKDMSFLGWITFEGNADFESGIDIKFNSVVSNNAELGFVDGSHLKLHSLDQVIDDVNLDPIIICENFNDKNGNARFVDGNLSTSTISGVTFTYAKWSLSGSHIMFVLCGEVAANTTLNVDVWASVTLPDYIKNKISGVFASTNIEVKDSRAYYDDWNSINIQTILQKTSDGVQILMIQNPTSTAIAHFRIQYDLLIDMD